MVKAHRPWPCPQHVAWPSSYLNGSSTLPESSLRGHSAYLNPSTCIFPAISAFPGFTDPAASSLKTEHTNEVRGGFLQYPHSQPSLKETHTGGVMQLQNVNSASLQKKLLIFDHTGNKTRLFYSPVLPLVQSPVITATQFAQVYDVNEEERATNMGQKHLPKYSLTEESDKDHIVNEESEMHEDTEEINALLYSDDSDFDDEDDDEVMSTGHSPLVSKRTYVMQELLEDLKEEVASTDWPNKKHKLTKEGYYRTSLPGCSAGSARLNEAYEYASDAESKYSSDQMYSAEETKDNSSMAGDIQFKKDKIRESLRVLENLVPGAKGKNPLLVIDGTIEYLKSLMTQTGSVGVNNTTTG